MPMVICWPVVEWTLNLKSVHVPRGFVCWPICSHLNLSKFRYNPSGYTCPRKTSLPFVYLGNGGFIPFFPWAISWHHTFLSLGMWDPAWLWVSACFIGDHCLDPIAIVLMIWCCNHNVGISEMVMLRRTQYLLLLCYVILYHTTNTKYYWGNKLEVIFVRI